jgi:DUF4097 and DUF4098 domain-containing protein YvlB
MNRIWMLLAAALLGTSAAIAATATTSFSKKVPLGSQSRVIVSNIEGSVTISTWDRREVDVQGELGDGIERVDVTQEGGRVDIKVVLKDNGWSEASFRNSAARLQIRLPAEMQIEASTVSASISVSGVRGRQRLKSVSGDVSADIAGMDMDVSTISGRVELTGGTAGARVRVTSVSGAVRLERMGGDVEVKSTSGDLDIDMQGASDVHASVVSGSISLTGKPAREADMDLTAVSGRIQVAAQVPAGLRYNVTTFSGRIRNCFGANSAPKGEESSRGGPGGPNLDGVRGEGKSSLRARSQSGTIEVCDR